MRILLDIITLLCRIFQTVLSYSTSLLEYVGRINMGGRKNMIWEMVLSSATFNTCPLNILDKQHCGVLLRTIDTICARPILCSTSPGKKNKS